MSFSRLLLPALLALSASPLSAAVSLIGQVGSLFGSDASTAVPVGSIAILVADTDQSTHAGLVDPFGTTFGVGENLGGVSGDRIVGVYTVSDLGEGIIGVDFGGTTFTYDHGFSAGNELWLLWFPTETLGTAMVGAGVPFGAYRSSIVDFDSGSDIAFVAPADGSVSSLYAFSASTGYGLASNADLSATSTTGASQPPTDLQLSRAALNPASGINAPIGTLTTTDADSTTFTYTLVAGEGATDNALFNVSGAALRVSDASTLSLGTSYSVRVQTQDADGHTFAKAFTLTASYVGAYFGTLSSGGHWALHVRGDNSAVYLAFLPARSSVLIAHFLLAADGSFTVTESEITDPSSSAASVAAGPRLALGLSASYTLSGSIAADGTVSGSLAGLDDSLTGALDSTPGPAPAAAGFYLATALGTATGSTYTIVGTSGQALVVTTSESSVDGAIGTVAADGTLTATTATHGAQLALALDPAGQSMSASLTPDGATSPVSFAGLPDTVTPEARVVNLSVRSTAGSGADTLIVGFVIGGSGTENLLLRGIGPGLVSFGVNNAVADPGMHVFDVAGAEIDANDDWSGSPALAQTFSRVGAFALTPASKDASLLATLPPGVYTFHVTNPAAAPAVALAELYELDGGTASVVNLSARTHVGSAENILIAGFVITGNSPRTLLLRGLGPSLAAYGVTGILADPQLELFRDGSSIARNDNWGGSLALKNAAALVGAGNLAADTSRDAALLLTLPPGVYSAQVSGVAGTTGVALVELFLLP